MNLGLVKAVLWLAALALLGGLGYSLANYNPSLRERALRGVSADDQNLVFNQPRPDPKQLPELPYEPVKNTFHTLNWTGKLPPPPPPPPPPPTPPEGQKSEPVERLLQVLFIQQDLRSADRSIAVVKYTGKLAAYQSREQVDGHVLAIGDVLPQAYDYWKLIAIDANDGLTFTCTRPGDFARAPADETVKPPVPISGFIPQLGDAVRPVTSPFPEIDPAVRSALVGSWPGRTQKTGRNSYLVGTEDAERISTNYLDILSNEVRHRSWRNPRTGQYEGIEVLEVSAGSVLSDFGVVSGDIIKSVNGHAVSSVNEAITFAKNNADYYETWEVVVENAGKERTITVQTPPSTP